MASREASAVLVVKDVCGSKRTALAWRSKDAKYGPGLWECPCGKVELGERPIDTAVRELEEETGLRATEERLEFIGSIRFRRDANGDDPITVYLFNLDLRDGEEPLNPEPTKRSEWSWFRLEQRAWKHLNLTPSTTALLRVALHNYLGV